MNDVVGLAAGYAIFLACVAALLARRRQWQRRGIAAPWPAPEIARFHLVLGRTLLVLSGCILVVAAIHSGPHARPLAVLSAAAVFSGVVAWRTSPRRALGIKLRGSEHR